MKLTMTGSGCTLVKEAGDKRISKESTVVFHIKRLLNDMGYHFTRMNPSKHGLTSCTLGVWDKNARIIFWHERYQIEAAHSAFNQDSEVFFQRVTMENN